MIKFFFTPAIAGLVALMAVAGSAVAQNATPASPLSGAQVLQGKWVKVCGAEAPGRVLFGGAREPGVEYGGISSRWVLAGGGLSVTMARHSQRSLMLSLTRALTKPPVRR